MPPALYREIELLTGREAQVVRPLAAYGAAVDGDGGAGVAREGVTPCGVDPTGLVLGWWPTLW
jgi:hypothetical protein